MTRSTQNSQVNSRIEVIQGDITKLEGYVRPTVPACWLFGLLGDESAVEVSMTQSD